MTLCDLNEIHPERFRIIMDYIREINKTSGLFSRAFVFPDAIYIMDFRKGHWQLSRSFNKEDIEFFIKESEK